MKFLLKILQKFVRKVRIQYSSIGPDNGLVLTWRQAFIWTNDGSLTDTYMRCSASMSQQLYFLFFLLCDLSDLILWAVELNTSLCVNFTHPHWLFFTSHHVAILFALCSHMVTHIFQSLHVCAFCVNNPFPKFVTRGILWVIGWDNQYCNQHLPPEQYSFDCKYIEDSHKSPWMTGIAPVPFVRERF